MKIVGTRSWVWWGSGIFIVAAGISTLLGGLIVSLEEDAIAGIVTEHDTIRSVYASPLTMCYLMSLAAGVNIYAGERRYASLPMTMLISPRRLHVVLAKYASALLLGAWCGLMYVVGVLIGGGSMMIAHGQALIPSLSIVRTLIVMLTICALWCLFGTGLGMCLSVIPALLTGFALALVLPAITSPILSGFSWGRTLIPLFPGVATNMASEPEIGALVATWLPWWGSYIVVILWTTIIALIGARIVLRADINVE